MKIAIIGSNGMLSVALTKAFMGDGHQVDVYGLDAPKNYESTSFFPCNLLKDELNYDLLMQSDMIIYASGAGVQAALSTPSSLMYALNVNVPIDITLQLKQREYSGIFVSFGSYMEIGLNDEDGRSFTEDEVVCSSLPVTNDYALSKRLFGRYMKDFVSDYTHWHFILPNMFSYNDKKPGTRLIPYVLQYCREYKQGLNPQAPSFSAGTQTRQYILLEDIKNVIYKAVDANMESGLYNIGGGEFCSIRSFIESMFAAYGVPCKDNYFGKSIRRDGDIKSLRIDGSKLQNAIHYLPSATMAEILCD